MELYQDPLIQRPSFRQIIDRIRGAEAYARSRAGDWEYSDTSIEDISRNLGVSIIDEVGRRLATPDKKVVVLDTGAESNPVALNAIAEHFASAIKAGQLELHGLHLWNGDKVTVTNNGINLHNQTPRSFKRSGIQCDFVFDSFGSLFHSSQESIEMFKTYLRAIARVLAPGGHVYYSIDSRKEDRVKFAETFRLNNVFGEPTGRHFMWHSVDGGSEFINFNLVFKMTKAI